MIRKMVKNEKHIKVYFTDGDLLYGSGKNLGRQIAYKKTRLLNSLKRKLSAEFVEAGLSCVEVFIVKGTRIMFTVHGKWFLPYYSSGIPKCPYRIEGCKEWSTKCIFSVLSDKNMKIFNKIMKKVDSNKFHLSVDEGL